MMSEKLGWWTIGFLFVGFNMTIFPLHKLGLDGMPRRVYTYLPSLGWQDLNRLATVGAFLLGIGMLLFFTNVLRSRRHGTLAGNDPWGSPTLEWSTSSPPPPYNFLYPPTVGGLYPLWEHPPDQPIVSGLRTNVRDVLVTTLVAAEPDHRTELPQPTLWPTLVAAGTGVGVIAAIFTPWGVPAGFVLVGLALIGWFWPRPPHRELLETQP